MESLAERFAGQLRAGDVITFSGEVGAGKTTFARALIRAMSSAALEVTSPTFTLMQSYDVTLKGNIPAALWHLDLYRLKHRDEAEALGLRELWPHIVLIEWPDIIESLLPEERLKILFDFGVTDDTRTLYFYGNEAWRNRLEKII